VEGDELGTHVDAALVGQLHERAPVAPAETPVRVAALSEVAEELRTPCRVRLLRLLELGLRDYGKAVVGGGGGWRAAEGVSGAHGNGVDAIAGASASHSVMTRALAARTPARVLGRHLDRLDLARARVPREERRGEEGRETAERGAQRVGLDLKIKSGRLRVGLTVVLA